MRIRKLNFYVDWAQIWLTLILAAIIVFGLLGLHKLDQIDHSIHRVTIVRERVINNKTITNNNTYQIPTLPGNA